MSLPTWLACFDGEAADREAKTTLTADGRLVHGPVSVHQMKIGCQDMAFGRGGGNLALFEGYLFDAQENRHQFGIEDEHWWEVACVARAYERWGADLFDHLDGGFLAAVWDAEAQRLLVGHDVFARCPVYFG